MVPRWHIADYVGATDGKEQRSAVGKHYIVRRVVSLALGIALHTVQVMVFFAHFIEEIAQILNHRRTRDDAQHLHASAQAQHGDIVVQAIGHREVFRHVTRGVSGTVIGDAVPRLRNGKQRGTDVATAQEDDRLHASQQLVGIGAVVGVALDHIGILLPQNAHFIGIFRANYRAIVVKPCRAHLRQNHRLTARLLDGEHDALKCRLIGLPGESHTNPPAVARHCGQRNGKQYGYYPMSHNCQLFIWSRLSRLSRYSRVGISNSYSSTFPGLGQRGGRQRDSHCGPSSGQP